jgi:tetratricopeptide (TPR) repeat protein
MIRALLALALFAGPAGAATFYELCDQAQAAKDPAAQAELYTKALGVWMPADSEANRALVYNNRGTSYQLLGQFEKSLADYSAALGIAPKDAATLENRAAIHESLKQPDAALADYAAALALDPDRAKSHNNMALIYFQKKKPGEALKHLDRVLALNPRDAKALNTRAIVHGQLKEREAALADYAAAIEADPNDPTPWVNRGLMFKGERKSASAAEDFVRASEVYRRLKKPELEMAELERAVAASPSSPVALAARGAALLVRGRLKDAEADGLAAASNGAKDPAGEVLVGRLTFERGDYEEAGRLFEAVLASKPHDRRALLGLAFASHKGGKRDDARARWTLALKLSPFLAQGRDAAEQQGYAFTSKEAAAFAALSAAK